MPRRSNRSRLLWSLALCRDRAHRLFIADHVANLLDGNDQGLDMTNTSFMLVSRFTHRFHVLTQSRYSVPRTARKHQFDVFECDLNDSEDNQNWLSDDEFLCKYRMSRDTLEAVTNLIKGDQIFQRGQRGPPQLPVKHQLMIFMHFIGREGETNGNQRSVFHVSQGRCQKARDRVILALTKLRDEYICWPDVDERKRISHRIQEKYHLPNCVGMMDGTLLELGTTPRCDDKVDYSGRKFRYSLTVNVINDDKRRIRAYLSGYPGTTHDNRVWRNMVECQRSNVFFSQGEYLVADTAYEPSEHVVPAFKSSPGMGLQQTPEKQLFNLCLSSPRVTAEHTMGLWKGRCGWLRKIKMLITNETESLEKVLLYIDATIVLYNMLIEMGCDVDENVGWDVDDECLTAIDDADRIPERSVLDMALPGGYLPGARRDQLFAYVCETFIPTMHFNTIPDSIEIELDSDLECSNSSGEDSD